MFDPRRHGGIHYLELINADVLESILVDSHTCIIMMNFSLI